MGEATGFLKWARETPTRRPVPVRLLDWQEVYEPFPRDDAADAGRAVHGLRHPVLQQRLPARQPDPRLERPRLPRPLARRHRAPARHEQLPRVHRPAVPGAVRGGVRARHQRRPGDDQAGRGRDHRPGLGRGLGHAAAADGARPASGSPSSAPARPGSPPPSSSTRAGHDVVVLERADRIGGLLRYGIPEFKMEKRHLDRRLDQMRGRGHRVPHQRRRRRRRRRRRAAGRRTTPIVLAVRRDRVARPARSRAASSPASTRRWSTCRCANRVQQGDLDAAADHRRGQARRDHRRRRHRRRLPRHRAPPGRGVGAPVRDHAPPARRRGPTTNPWPQWPPDLRARRRPTRRAASASTASTPSASSATATATCAALRLHEVEMVDGRFEKVEGTDLELPGRAGAAGDGLRRAGAGRRGSSSSASTFDERGNVARDDDFMTSVPGVFVAGDMGRGQSLIVWAIAEGRSRRRRRRPLADGRDRSCPTPIEPTTRPLHVTAVTSRREHHRPTLSPMRFPRTLAFAALAALLFCH